MPSIIVQKKLYRSDIDGLRAIAVGAVLLFHLNPAYLNGGFLGVDLFFVISGYLITKIIYSALNAQNFSLGDFYNRRIKRISPLLMTVLLLTSIAAALLFTPSDLNNYWVSLWYTLTLRTNFAFTENSYFATSLNEAPLLHLWSLAIEIQFYLLWPLILCGFYLGYKNSQKNPQRTLFITVLSLIIINIIFTTIFTKVSPIKAYYYSYSRTYEFLIGALIALNIIPIKHKYKPLMGLIGLLIIGLCLFYYSNKTSFPSYSALLPCMGAALFLLDDTHAGANSFLTHRIFVYIGQLSFALYLWHWPILVFFRYLYSENTLTPQVQLLTLSLTFMLAQASHHFIESPLRKIVFSIKQSIIYLYSIPAIILLLIIIATLSPSLHPIIYLTTQEALTSFQKGVCYDRFDGSCTIGADNQPTRILMVGDSHAAHYAGFLEIVSQQENWSVKLLSASTCSPIFANDISRLQKSYQTNCATLTQLFAEKWQDYDHIFLAAYWPLHLGKLNRTDFQQNYLEKLDATLKILTKKKAVYVFADLPNVHNPAIKALKFNQWGLNHFFTYPTSLAAKNHATTMEANELIRTLCQKYPNCYWVDVTPFMPSTFRRENRPLYMDDNHLNRFGGHTLGRLFHEQTQLLQTPTVLTQP